MSCEDDRGTGDDLVERGEDNEGDRNRAMINTGTGAEQIENTPNAPLAVAPGPGAQHVERTDNQSHPPPTVPDQVLAVPIDPARFIQRQIEACNLLRQHIAAANNKRFNARRYFHNQIDDNGFVRIQIQPLRQDRTRQDRILNERNLLEIRREQLRIRQLEINK